MKRLVPALLALSLVTACAIDAEPGTAQQSLVDGTPDAIGLLALLNDGSTTLAVLDYEVPLDRRAATNLIAHRDGADATFGTGDDDLFESIGEVDDIKYVGARSMERLVAFAAAQGFVPTGDDPLGTFDNVAFTVAEAERVLAAVNDSAKDVLRYEVPLDSRAVSSILAARPVLSMGELASLYYVGTAMLTRLKNYVELPASTERIDCLTTSDCPGELRCTGTTNDGSHDYGKCYDPTIPPGAGADCSADAPCGPNLVCLGQVAWGSGFCVPAWQNDSFTNATRRTISTSGTVVEESVIVRGLATVPVDISVHHDIRHSNPESLRITLRSNNGDESVMWDGPNESGALPATLTRNCCIPSDDYVNGRWWLIVENVGGAGVGETYGFTLEITSQWD